MDKLREECGVFGVFASERMNVASMTYYALYALQHRGQDACGIVVNDGGVFTKKKDLIQPGEFACEEVVKVSTEKYEFPYVRVLGPIRDYTQVEVSLEDAKLLGIDPPVRDSGDLDNSESVYLEGPNGKIFKKNCCIRANKHIHCNKLENIGHNNSDIVSVSFNGKIINHFSATAGIFQYI